MSKITIFLINVWELIALKHLELQATNFFYKIALIFINTPKLRLCYHLIILSNQFQVLCQKRQFLG